MMYCPNCAASFSGDQKFCRSCGFDLQIISQALSGESEPMESDESKAVSGKRIKTRKKKIESLGLITLMSGFMAGCLIPISIGLLSDWQWLGQLILVLAGMAGLLVIGGITLMAYPSIAPGAETTKEPSRPARLRKGLRTNQLQPVSQAELALSVTEATTGLLNTPAGEDSRRAS
jgi:hypothetical protein